MRFGWSGLCLLIVACSRSVPDTGQQPTPTSTPGAPPANAATTNATTTNAAGAASPTLTQARKAFVTKLTDEAPRGTAAPAPPRGVLELVRYPSPAGQLAAYVTPRAKGGKRRPAIVWIVGGFDNGIDGTAWEPAPRDNDQSARAFREAGVVLMMPSLRGGNDNPGKRETLYGEVEDVVAARDWLAQQEGVDPERIYLGGHSTGGTLALLVAETTDKFRTVFAFGPVADARAYGGYMPMLRDASEARVRSPLHFMASIRTPTFIIEGASSPNAGALPHLGRAAGGAPVKTFAVEGADHFSLLAPVTALLAKSIVADHVEVTDAALAASLAR